MHKDMKSRSTKKKKELCKKPYFFKKTTNIFANLIKIFSKESLNSMYYCKFCPV